ncbi:MAG TPA: hydrogenase maturation protease [Vicinamibacterales bacterium]|nr:hydrogenase maturation protease [Vicinamibacterales bacterium]
MRVIRVLGLGNVLMSDDGFGPYVVRVLEATCDFRPDVEVIDVGTPGLDLTPYLLDAEAVIFIDTVKAPGPAGRIQTLRIEDMLRMPPQPRLGPHDPGVKEALLTVAAAGRGPRDVLLVGVVPGGLEPGVSLSPPVRAAVPAAVLAVLDELERLGAPASQRETRLAPDAWWERAPAGAQLAG